jgi:hypothetical protein
MKKLLTLCFLACICPFLKVSAQELQSDIKTAASNYFETEDYTLSWTIGEAVILTISDSTVIMTQGFQQPKFKKKYVKEDLPEKDNIWIGPNPTIENIEIELDKPIDKNLPIIVEIYDILGRQMIVREFRGQRFSINVSFLASGTYLVKVSVDGKNLGAQKLQKLD